MVETYLLPAVLAVAGVGSVALVAISAVALLRRRSPSYFLVTLALGTLALRTLLGTVMLGGTVSPEVHHLLEHVLDAVVIGLLFAAVYAARRAGPESRADVRYGGYDD